MKKQIIVTTTVALVCSAVFSVLGYKIGHKNGYIEVTSQIDGPFWNLLFLRSETKEELIEFNESSLFAPLVSLNAELNDPLLSKKNKKRIEYMTLAAKDYVKHLKDSISEANVDEETELPFKTDLYLNATKVPSDHFSRIEVERERIFAEIWDEDSYVLEYIMEVKDAKQSSRGNEG